MRYLPGSTIPVRRPATTGTRTTRTARTTRTTGQPHPTEQGSQTTEYALLLIVAATIAMVLLTWAKSDGGISSLMDTIIGEVLNVVGIG